MAFNYDEYKQLNYLEGTGNQVILDNKKGDSTGSSKTLNIEFQLTQIPSSNQCIFGHLIKSENYPLVFALYINDMNNFEFYIADSKINASIDLGVLCDLQRHKFSLSFDDSSYYEEAIIEFDEKKFTEQHHGSYSFDSMKGSIGIFASDAINNTNENDIVIGLVPINMKLYSYSNSFNLTNLVPAQRKSDNVIGVYDITKNEFYTNSGNEEFTYGKIITTSDKLQYLMETKNQIKNVLMNKGITISNKTTFREYPELINNNLGILINNASGLFRNFSNMTTTMFNKFEFIDYIKCGSASYMFANCSELTEINTSNIKNLKPTVLNYMFQNCTSLTDLCKIDCSKTYNPRYNNWCITN